MKITTRTFFANNNSNKKTAACFDFSAETLLTTVRDTNMKRVTLKTDSTPVLLLKSNSIPSIIIHPFTRCCRPKKYFPILLFIVSYMLLVTNVSFTLAEEQLQTAATSSQSTPNVAAVASPFGGNSNVGVYAPSSGASAVISTPSLSASSSSSTSAASSLSILQQFSPNCSAVSNIFLASGISAVEIPAKPSQEMVLRYCESPSVGTCCTYKMENKMAMQSRSQLEKHSKDQVLKITNVLNTKAQKFNEMFRKLLMESKEEFHNMFMRTYGVIYQQNSFVFSDLFKELESYYARGRVDLMATMDKFFNILYQKMFEVLNSQYKFDQKFLNCVSQHMKELKPFGDVPDKLALQVKRSFVATRTFAKALSTASEVARKLISIHLNADCTAALTKMQHCGACKGYAERPCTNYCVNVIKGCLHYLNEFDVEWENFVLAMDKVAERLLGSFNIVMVVEPINIKISEAIMNFQDSGQDITNRVFQGCGRPTLGLRRIDRALSPKLGLAIAPSQLMQSEHIFAAATLPAVTQAEQIETDILDIDAKLDESIVLREKRNAEPVRNSEENSSPRTNKGDEQRNGGKQNRQQNKRKPQNNRKTDSNDYTGRDPMLDKMVRDIRQRVKESKKFWSNLPYQICSNDEISTSSDVDGMCWNGHTIDRYMHSVSAEHGRNPEFPGNPATAHQTAQVTVQLNNLKNAINHLRNAYNGQDVDWSEQEEPYYGSGSGSGGGSDDEDDDEGSGLGLDETYQKPTGSKTDHTDHPTVRINNEDDEDAEAEDADTDVSGTILTHTARPKYTGGSTSDINVGGTGSNKGHETNMLDNENDGDNDNEHKAGDDIDDGAHRKSSGGSSSKIQARDMSLRRALLLYLLPLYMAWFGGICADLL